MDTRRFETKHDKILENVVPSRINLNQNPVIC